MSHITDPRQLGVGVTLLSRVISSLTRPWFLALLWLLVVVYAARFVVFKLPTPPAFTDFNHYYVASLALRTGSNPYRTRYDALATSLGLNLSGLDLENQPPTLLLFFEPLTRLSPHTAYWVWICISFATLVIALCLLLWDTALDARQALLFGALLFLYPPVYEHFYFANFQIVISLLDSDRDLLHETRRGPLGGFVARAGNGAEGVSSDARLLSFVSQAVACPVLDGDRGRHHWTVYVVGRGAGKSFLPEHLRFHDFAALP